MDLDGTLISSYMDTLAKKYDTWHVLPRRRTKLNELRMRGDSIAIITNQGGVAHGFVTEQACWNKLEHAIAALELTYNGVADEPPPPQVYVCMYDVRGRAPYNDQVQAVRRKPSGAMLREAMHDYRQAARLGVLYVGDRPEDRAAAADAGVAFQWAHVFFGA